jgi:hypothetical protein
LTKCIPCSNEVKERSVYKKLLTQGFGTQPDTPHPHFKELEAFYYHKLGKEKEKQILNHLIRCDECKEDLEIFRTERMIEEGQIPVPAGIPKELPHKFGNYINDDLKGKKNISFSIIFDFFGKYFFRRH